jgi:hypothetical protein
VLAFVGVERFERAGQDHPTEIPEDGSDVGHAGPR